MTDPKKPTRAESIFGLFLFGGALIFMGKCALGSHEPEQAKCATELDCKIRANTTRMKEACVKAASGQRHLEDRQFDLARGLRTGSMSASDVRGAQAELEATRQYTSQAKAECEAAQAEAGELGKQATAAYRQEESAKSPPAKTAVAAPTVKPRAKPPPGPGRSRWPPKRSDPQGAVWSSSGMSRFSCSISRRVRSTTPLTA